MKNLIAVWLFSASIAFGQIYELGLKSDFAGQEHLKWQKNKFALVDETCSCGNLVYFPKKLPANMKLVIGVKIDRTEPEHLYVVENDDDVKNENYFECGNSANFYLIAEDKLLPYLRQI